MNEIPRKKRLSIDEVMETFSQMAQDPEDPDRFRALKLLATIESASTILPPPMADGEVSDLLAVMMKGAGVKLTQSAYSRAFPTQRHALYSGTDVTYPKATDAMKIEARKITSLKLLNKHFPEGKVNGVPKGFPSGRSIAVKVEWCQQQALKMLVERSNRERQEAHESLISNDESIREDMDVLPHST